MRVQYSVYAMHRRKDIYGEDALEFRPERWGDGSKIGRGWEYLPFNGGPRICLGRKYTFLITSDNVGHNIPVAALRLAHRGS